jgi:ATP/maltotriose-dependent transcriptional regulator MalT
MGTLVPLIQEAIDDNPGLPVFRAVLALAHADADQITEARQVLAGFSSTGFTLPLDVTWLTGMIAIADAASACADPTYADPILDQLAPFADQWLYTDVAASGPVGRSVVDLLVVLGRHDEAEYHFARAAVSTERADARFFSAQTDLSWGRMCAARGDPGDRDRAHDLLTRARQEAATRGYGTVERRAAAALGALEG